MKGWRNPHPPAILNDDEPARRDRWLAAAVIGLGVAIPTSVAASNVLIALLVVAWLVAGRVALSARGAWRNPVGRMVILLVGILGLSAIYGGGNIAERWGGLGKYLDLLLMIPLLDVFRLPTVRSTAAFALLATLALTLVLSLGLASGVIEPGPLFKAAPHDASVFKDHITQGLLIAYAAFAWYVKGVESGGQKRFMLWLGALLASIDVLFLLKGRTGYVVLAALGVLLAVDRYRGKRAAVAVVILALLAAGAYLMPGPFHERVAAAGREALRWQPDRAHHSPVGLRLDFYETSVRIIRSHPLLGVGVGGFPQSYRTEAARFGMVDTANPHNQFLLTAAEAGLPGLLALLMLFWVQWRETGDMVWSARLLARGMLLTFVVGCLLNSLLIDYTERLCFVFASALLYSGYGELPTCEMRR